MAGTSWSPGGERPARGDSGVAELGLGARPDGCAVEYRLQRDAGGAFTAAITVKNTGGASFESWKLAFDLPATSG